MDEAQWDAAFENMSLQDVLGSTNLGPPASHPRGRTPEGRSLRIAAQHPNSEVTLPLRGRELPIAGATQVP